MARRRGSSNDALALVYLILLIFYLIYYIFYGLFNFITVVFCCQRCCCKECECCCWKTYWAKQDAKRLPPAEVVNPAHIEPTPEVVVVPVEVHHSPSPVASYDVAPPAMIGKDEPPPPSYFAATTQDHGAQPPYSAPSYGQPHSGYDQPYSGANQYPPGSQYPPGPNYNREVSLPPYTMEGTAPEVDPSIMAPGAQLPYPGYADAPPVSKDFGGAPTSYAGPATFGAPAPYSAAAYGVPPPSNVYSPYGDPGASGRRTPVYGATPAPADPAPYQGGYNPYGGAPPPPAM